MANTEDRPIDQAFYIDQAKRLGDWLSEETGPIALGGLSARLDQFLFAKRWIGTEGPFTVEWPASVGFWIHGNACGRTFTHRVDKSEDWGAVRRAIGDLALDWAKTLPDINANDSPQWNEAAGMLRFGERETKISTKAKNVRAVLSAFKKSGWPSRDVALPNKLVGELYRVNQTTLATGVKFSANGIGTGAKWQAIPPPE